MSYPFAYMVDISVLDLLAPTYFAESITRTSEADVAEVLLCSADLARHITAISAPAGNSSSQPIFMDLDTIAGVYGRRRDVHSTGESSTEIRDVLNTIKLIIFAVNCFEMRDISLLAAAFSGFDLNQIDSRRCHAVLF
jgi:hypothetical protein